MKWILQIIIIISTSVLTAIVTYLYVNLTINITDKENVKLNQLMNKDCACSCENILIDDFYNDNSKNRLPSSDTTPSFSDIEQPSGTTDRESREVDRYEQELGHKIYQLIETQKNHIETLQSFVASQQGNHNQILQEKFDAEEIDYDWSIPQEDSIYNLFDTDPVLNQISPSGVSCKSQNCQIIIPSNEIHQFNKAYDSLLESSIYSNEQQSYESVSYFTDPEKGHITIYLSRPGDNRLFLNKK